MFKTMINFAAQFPHEVYNFEYTLTYTTPEGTLQWKAKTELGAFMEADNVMRRHAEDPTLSNNATVLIMDKKCELTDRFYWDGETVTHDEYKDKSLRIPTRTIKSAYGETISWWA